MRFHIEPKWQDALAANNLDSYSALLNYRGENCMSSHTRGATWRLTLSCGQDIFIKQDYYTKLQPIIRSLVRLSKPLCNTEKERRAFALAAEHGFIVPEVIAWGESRRFGLPNTGVMAMLPMEGVPVDRFVVETDNREKARAVIKQAEELLMRLQVCRLDWNVDCKPEHFFVLPDGTIGLIDLERLAKRSKPLDKDYCEMQLQRFRSLLPKPFGNAEC
ncbi:MAG: hypothetical protein GX561_11120 [Lentisphaerae bacterium]|mgnify:FL=1|jgi:hypothetical protein|nr:hypothetical protein [Lentisphaerota bacterium]